MKQQEIREHINNKFNEWLDNSDPENLGIVKWAEQLLPDYTPNKTPGLHIELYLQLLTLYNPELVNKYERLFELISWRGSGKSTAANMIFPSYIIANNGREIKILVDFEIEYDKNWNLKVKGGKIIKTRINESFIVIISETSSMAEAFTERIKAQFDSNRLLRYYYKTEIKSAYDDMDGKWTRIAFQINNCHLLGVGVLQQIRGRIRGASRPSLIMADDIYSENSVITENSRAKIKRWWAGAVMNSIDDVKGKCGLLGTILHDDTVLVQMEKNSLWETIKRSLMPIDQFHKFISKHLRIDRDLGKAYLPYDNVENDDKRRKQQREYFTKVSKKENYTLAWEQRANLYFIALKFKEAIVNQQEDTFYQEYFHITRTDANKIIKASMFFRVRDYEIKYEHGYNWIKLENKWYNCNIEFGIDLASGFGKDYAVIIVVAVLPDNRRVILARRKGKWALRDDTKESTTQDLRYNKVIKDRTLIERIGIIDEAYRLALIYHPRIIKIGQAGQEKRDVYQFQQVFKANYYYGVQIVGRPQTSQGGKKEERMAETLSPYYETHVVYHVEGLDSLEYQLEYLGKSENDDEADALECAFWNIQIPESIEIDMFDNKESEWDYTEDIEFDWRVN